MRKFFNKVIAVALTAFLTIGSVFTGTASIAAADTNEITYPWTTVEGETTADYIADSYDEVESGHVFESVTQERLLDILSSKGNYYIVFGGPEIATSQTVLATINEQAKADGITKIYHFDPYIDGDQIDITDENTVFKGGRNTSVYELWTRILALLPESEAISNYDSSDTLLFSFSNDGTAKAIKASYSLKDEDEDDFDANAAKSEIAKVFRGGVADGAVVKSDVRTDYQFFKRVYNGAATYIETRQGEEATANRLGKATEIFTDADEEGFTLHQVNYSELINLLKSDGEHYIFFGASWCHNTQAIIGQVERKAKANGKTVYVYDTTIGNQLTFGEGADVDTVTGTSSVFNSRNNATTADGNNNISYLYGELVKYLGDFITENNSNKNNSIAYFPNGDLSGTVTSVAPWEDAEEGTVKNAIRLQMPFFIAYDKNAENPVTKQWLHKNAANDGTYTEYMLELAWVLNIPEAAAYTERTIDGLSYVDFAAEAVKELSTVLGDKEPVADEPETTTGKQETTTKEQETTTKLPEVTTKSPEVTTKASVTKPGKAKVKTATKKKSAKKAKISLKKVAGAKGYQIQISATKDFKKVLVKKNTKKVTFTVSSKKIKNKKKLYVRAKAYKLDGKAKVYGKWSNAKKIKIKK